MSYPLPAARPDPHPLAMRTVRAALPWLTTLAPAAGAGHRPASSGAQYTRAVRAVGPRAAEWAVEVGFVVAQRVAAEIPSHVADDGIDVLRMGTESTVLQLLIALAGEEVDAAVTPESLGGIPEFVRRRVSLDELLRGIGLGHSVIAAAFLAACARLGAPEQRHEQMRVLSEQMFVFFDHFSTQMAAFYRDEQARWAQSEAAGRLGLVQELLHGHDDRLDAGRRLRYDLTKRHVALVLWSSARTLDADPEGLRDVAGEMLRGAGCEQKLVVIVGPGTVWAWATPARPAGFLTRLTGLDLPANTHAVCGGIDRGLTGFRASHADAKAIFELRARHASGASRVVAYAEADLLSLLMADRERALRFARHELAGLAAPGALCVDLRQTLAAYLDTGGSPNAAAARLLVSRNTVSYRVRRAEELLGRPLAERRQQLQAALAILAEHADFERDWADRPQRPHD